MRIIIGISGASGVVMGYELLKALRAADIETHLVVTEAAAKTLACATSLCLEDLTDLASVSYDCRDMEASIASEFCCFFAAISTMIGGKNFDYIPV